MGAYIKTHPAWLGDTKVDSGREYLRATVSLATNDAPLRAVLTVHRMSAILSNFQVSMWRSREKLDRGGIP